MQDEQRIKAKGQPDELDGMLDQALAKYAAVEPRPGLDNRILAHLQNETWNASRSGWQWAIAGAVVAAVIVMLMLSWRSSHRPHPVIAHQPPISAPIPSPNEGTFAPQPRSAKEHAGRRLIRRIATHRVQNNEFASKNPKLDMFPSPQPLSEEEFALVRYVRAFPQEATLIAQAQEEFDLETQREMNDPASQNRPSGSIQQER